VPALCRLVPPVENGTRYRVIIFLSINAFNANVTIKYSLPCFLCKSGTAIVSRALPYLSRCTVAMREITLSRRGKLKNLTRANAERLVRTCRRRRIRDAGGLIAIPRIKRVCKRHRRTAARPCARQKTRRLPHRVFITVICPSGIISGQRGPEGLNSGWLLARKVSLILHCRSRIHLSLPVPASGSHRAATRARAPNLNSPRESLPIKHRFREPESKRQRS